MTITKLLHKSFLLRKIARVIFSHATLTQRFYKGKISFDAVEHSWAWTGQNRYETFDQPLQKALHLASTKHHHFIDLGSNIGAMTIGTLLHNPAITATAVDANARAVRLLKKSLKINKLSHRCEIIHAAITDTDIGQIFFDETGSVTGHVTENGKAVRAIQLSGLLNRFEPDKKILVKMDVEGYEAVLVEDLKHVTNLANFTFFIEVHAAGFNDVGNPAHVFTTLKKLDAKITDLSNQELNELHPEMITQIIVRFPHAG